MKKRKKQLVLDAVPSNNPVAKFAHQFNRAEYFTDKTQYRRHAKHKNREVSAKTLSIGVLAVASSYYKSLSRTFFSRLTSEMAFELSFFSIILV